MKFLLLHTLPPDIEQIDGDDISPGMDSRLLAWVDEMSGRGVLLDGSRLRPSSDATTVRAPDGRPVVIDGPFAETKEQIAGYDLVDCDDRDAAVAIASAHPTLEVGSIEVRAFDPGMPDPDVPDSVAPGRFRYLMFVLAEMRREAAAATSDSPPAEEEGDDTDIDAWVDSVSDRRIYGWPLDWPDTAVTLRRQDGRIVTTDGPFAETKEQIAGYDLLECRNLDEAISAAATHPMATRCAIELRPLWMWPRD
jgi:hypothetical protein